MTRDTVSIQIGRWTVRIMSGGISRVDGGGMMGIVPYMIWKQWYPPDSENRIQLDTNCLLVQGFGKTILVDSGCGNKLTPKEKDFYGTTEDDWILPNLKRAGIDPEEIDLVFPTHLHTDHAGGVIQRNTDGTLQATFPKAQVVVQEREYQDSLAGLAITPNAYNPINYQQLVDDGKMVFSQPGREWLPGVRTLATGVITCPYSTNIY